MITFLKWFNYVAITFFMFVFLMGGINACYKHDWIIFGTSIMLLVGGSYAYTRNKSKRGILEISWWFMCTFSYFILKNLFPSLWVVFAILLGVVYVVGDHKIEKKYKDVEDV